MSDLKVKDYMTRDIVTVLPSESMDTVLDLIEKTKHDGFPVVMDNELVGIITARDLISRKKTVREAMSRRVVVTYPETKIMDAARVMFREGYSRLPVVNEEKRVVGIITNMDVLRSQIERATPEKVEKLKDYFEKLHNITTKTEIRKVTVSELRPTQNKITFDELRGREYELKRGLAEHIVVAQLKDRLLLLDGHHRALAAMNLGIEELTAYIIIIDQDITLGMEKTAEVMGLKTLKDIKIDESSFKGIAEVIEGKID